MVLYNGLVDFMRSLYPKYGYQEVMTPQLFRADLFKTSGHYEKFHDDMFWFAGADEGEELGVKAMNCPGHCRIFELRKRSYRELPLRLAEFSRLHRNERSGTLTGLARVRSMAQDDAHIFCEPEQVRGGDRTLLRADGRGLPRPRLLRRARSPSRRVPASSSASPPTGTRPSRR